jgi:DNA-binding NtrC family response regulator
MTAYGSEEMRNEAYSRGAYYYYEKPIDIPDLIEKAKAIGIPLMSAEHTVSPDAGHLRGGKDV